MESEYFLLTRQEKNLALLARILTVRKKSQNELNECQDALQRMFNKMDRVKDENIMNQVLELIFPIIKRTDVLKEAIKQADELIKNPQQVEEKYSNEE